MTKAKERQTLYKRWHAMISRCHNPVNPRYRDYGRRGIFVCAEWREFGRFIEWALANGFRPELTLERIDVNGPYSAENCEWASTRAQGNNKRNSVRITYAGESKTIQQWSEETGIPWSTIRLRFSSVLQPDQILATGYSSWVSGHKIAFGGETHSIKEWAAKLGISYAVLQRRLHRGWDIERALCQT